MQFVRPGPSGSTEPSALNFQFVESWQAARPIPRFDAGYYAAHLLVPLLLAFSASIWLMLLGGDQWLAHQIYSWGGGGWLLRKHFVTAQIIHPGGKYLSLGLWLLCAGAYWRSHHNAARLHWRRPLGYLLVATVVATCLIAVLKSQLAMDCAWDVAGYGGQRPYLALFEARPSWLPSAGCFPAGHAGSGYCWLALYFFFAKTVPKWRWHGLAVGLLLGLVFGVSQQLRGAHFASHDVATLLICWLVALGLSGLIMRTPAGWP